MTYVTPHVIAQTQPKKYFQDCSYLKEDVRMRCNVDNKLKQFPLNLNEVDYLHFLTKLINTF